MRIGLKVELGTAIEFIPEIHFKKIQMQKTSQGLAFLMFLILWAPIAQAQSWTIQQTPTSSFFYGHFLFRPEYRICGGEPWNHCPHHRWR